MKKVCFVKWIIDRVDGGLKVAVNLANELSDKYEVHLVSVLATEESFFDLKSNVRYENLSSKKLSMQKHFLKAVLLLREYIKKHDIQIVFGIGMSMNSVGIASTLGLDAVFISCDHTNSIVDIDTKVKKIQRYFGAKAADKIITLTTEDRDNYIKQYKIDSNKVECIYNWINSINNVEKYNLNSKKLPSNFSQALKTIKKVIDEWGNNKDEFVNFLLDKVEIIRTEVPEGTDLNHYFEIMNTRGEQLEKHEVLKARLMKKLSEDIEKSLFAKMWDACSDMSRYAVMGFEPKIRELIFGNKWSGKPKCFIEIIDDIKEYNKEIERQNQ